MNDNNIAFKINNDYISVTPLLNIISATGKKLDSNFSHVDEGLYVIEKDEAP